MRLKLTVGIRSTEAPVFMEGEAPGVFVTKEFEIPDGESDVGKALWAIHQEEDAIKESVELKWEELK